MSNYTFGNYIYERRTKKGLSQSQLGEKLGVTNKAVSRWENGSAYPSTELMLPLAEALGVTIEDLYKAISDRKLPQTRSRKLLEFLAKHANLLTWICGVLIIIPYLLIIIFSKIEDKNTLIISIPILCVVMFVAVYFMFILFKKNPFLSSKAFDFYVIFFLCCMALGYVSCLFYFIKDLYYGTDFITCVMPAIFMGIIRMVKKLYK